MFARKAARGGRYASNAHYDSSAMGSVPCWHPGEGSKCIYKGVGVLSKAGTACRAPPALTECPWHGPPKVMGTPRASLDVGGGRQRGMSRGMASPVGWHEQRHGALASRGSLPSTKPRGVLSPKSVSRRIEIWHGKSLVACAAHGLVGHLFARGVMWGPLCPKSHYDSSTMANVSSWHPKKVSKCIYKGVGVLSKAGTACHAPPALLECPWHAPPKVMGHTLGFPQATMDVGGG